MDKSLSPTVYDIWVCSENRVIYPQIAVLISENDDKSQNDSPLEQAHFQTKPCVQCLVIHDRNPYIGHRAFPNSLSHTRYGLGMFWSDIGQVIRVFMITRTLGSSFQVLMTTRY